MNANKDFSLADFDIKELNYYFIDNPIIKKCEVVSSDRDEDGIDFTLKVFLKDSSSIYMFLTDLFSQPGIDVLIDTSAVQGDPNPKMFPKQKYAGVAHSYEEIADKINDYFLDNIHSKARR